MKIDAVDAVILSVLLVDARTSFKEIAEIVQKSTNTIRTRFNKLKKEGIISGSTIQINPKIMGQNCVGRILIYTDFKEEKNFSEKILKDPGVVGWDFQIGNFNHSLFFSLKTIKELDDLINKVSQHPHVKRTSVDVCVDATNIDHPENLVFEPLTHINAEKIRSRLECWKAKEKIINQKLKEDNSLLENKFDKIDCEIINLLVENARVSFRKIGKKMSVSNQVIIKRYQRLKKTVICNSTITIDLGKIGYTGFAVFNLKLSTDYPASLIFKKIINLKNVIIAYRTIGDFQIVAGIPFKQMDELMAYYIKISKIPGITGVQLIFPKIFHKWPVNTFSKM